MRCFRWNGVNNDFNLFCFRFIRQERFRTITQSYYRSANAVIIGNEPIYFNIMIYSVVAFCSYHNFLLFTVYDITKRSSFLSIQRWIEEVRRYTTSDVILILIGNKCDLEDEREVIHVKDSISFKTVVSLSTKLMRYFLKTRKLNY